MLGTFDKYLNILWPEAGEKSPSFTLKNAAKIYSPRTHTFKVISNSIRILIRALVMETRKQNNLYVDLKYGADSDRFKNGPNVTWK